MSHLFALSIFTIRKHKTPCMINCGAKNSELKQPRPSLFQWSYAIPKTSHQQITNPVVQCTLTNLSCIQLTGTTFEEDFTVL